MKKFTQYMILAAAMVQLSACQSTGTDQQGAATTQINALVICHEFGDHLDTTVCNRIIGV